MGLTTPDRGCFLQLYLIAIPGVVQHLGVWPKPPRPWQTRTPRVLSASIAIQPRDSGVTAGPRTCVLEKSECPN